jgi:hypothetical protein
MNQAVFSSFSLSSFVFYADGGFENKQKGIQKLASPS